MGGRGVHTSHILISEYKGVGYISVTTAYSKAYNLGVHVDVCVVPCRPPLHSLLTIELIWPA